MALGKNQFSDARQLFKDAVQQDPTNAVVSGLTNVVCMYTIGVTSLRRRLRGDQLFGFFSFLFFFFFWGLCVGPFDLLGPLG